ncbi:MAG: hypothetical protein ACRCTJ_04045 [Brevinema sp.]
MDKLREQYKKLIGKEAPLKFKNTTLQKFINWHIQAKDASLGTSPMRLNSILLSKDLWISQF